MYNEGPIYKGIFGNFKDTSDSKCIPGVDYTVAKPSSGEK